MTAHRGLCHDEDSPPDSRRVKRNREQAWRAFDPDGHTLDPKVEDQPGILGREVVRAAGQFAQHEMTTPEAENAEAAQQPISEQEIAAV